MKTQEEFEAFYNNELLSTLEELEVIRKKKLRFNLLVLLFVVVLIITIVLTVISQQISDTHKMLIVGGAVTGFLAFLIPNGLRISKYNFDSRFKTEIIERIIHFISPDLNYDPKGCIHRDDFRASRIFLQGIDKYNGDDYVEGTIDKTHFRFSELHAQYRVQSKNSSSYHTIFRGLFFIADFNKSFEGSTVLTPNNLGGGKRLLKRMAGLSRREKYVELEDPEFNKLYNCYSDDDIKARYILSPALMRRIIDFRLKYPVNSISISFVNEKLYMAISYRRQLFEAKIGATLINKHLLESYFNDIKLAVDIVEDLNLNTRIWSKS
jgi:hypothetical protein